MTNKWKTQPLENASDDPRAEALRCAEKYDLFFIELDYKVNGFPMYVYLGEQDNVHEFCEDYFGEMMDSNEILEMIEVM